MGEATETTDTLCSPEAAIEALDRVLLDFRVRLEARFDEPGENAEQQTGPGRQRSSNRRAGGESDQAAQARIARAQQALAFLSEAQPPRGGVPSVADPRVDFVAHDHACRVGVASFWANFTSTGDTAEAPDATEGAGANGKTEPEPAFASNVVEVDSTPEASASQAAEEPQLDEPTAPDDVTNPAEAMRASALKAALAAARAELEDADKEPPHATPGCDDSGAGSGLAVSPQPSALSQKTVSEPRHATDDLTASSDPEPEAVSEEEQTLSPEKKAKLRMLRRLNPSIPKKELLAQLAAQDDEPVSRKARSWWPFRKWRRA